MTGRRQTQASIYFHKFTLIYTIFVDVMSLVTNKKEKIIAVELEIKLSSRISKRYKINI